LQSLSEFSGSSGFNWIGFAALIVSLLSIFCTLLYLYLGKRVEIVSLKFQKFCIIGLDQILSDLDGKFKNAIPEPKDIQTLVTDVSTDIQVFLITLKTIYADIDIQQMTLLLESFTDFVYKTTSSGADVKQRYFSTRVLLYAQLYDYALKKELSLAHRLGIKKRFPKLFK
jgi:hypothetical protein